MTTLWKYDAVFLIETYGSKQLSPSDVLAQTLTRIDTLQPQINAYSYQNNEVMDDAVASEKRWAIAKPIGPMDVIPIIVKDNMSVNNMPASWGNTELATRMRVDG